jgi:hypothetical protein
MYAHVAKLMNMMRHSAYVSDNGLYPKDQFDWFWTLENNLENYVGMI